MKITFKKLFYLLVFISISLGAKAQYSAVPDTVRYGIGLDGDFPQGDLSNSYTFGLGVVLQADFPLNEKFYFDTYLGYNSFLPDNNDVIGNPEAIAGIKLPDMNTIPLSFSIKYFLIRTFYVQADGGGALLLNKSALYANYNTALTFGPEMGLLFKLPNKRYLDVGFRYEWMQSYYTGFSDNRFLGLRVAYAFNLK